MCVIYARRVEEPWIDDVHAGHILRCNVCKLTYLKMEDEVAFDIFWSKNCKCSEMLFPHMLP